MNIKMSFISIVSGVAAFYLAFYLVNVMEPSEWYAFPTIFLLGGYALVVGSFGLAGFWGHLVQLLE